MQLLYLSICLNKLLVDWNLSIFKYFWMLQKLAPLQYYIEFCINVNILLPVTCEIHLICKSYAWNTSCKMYRNDFITSGLISSLCNAYSFHELYLSVNVPLISSELVTVSVTDTRFNICGYVFVYTCTHISLQIYRQNRNKKLKYFLKIIFETQSI